MLYKKYGKLHHLLNWLRLHGRHLRSIIFGGMIIVSVNKSTTMLGLDKKHLNHVGSGVARPGLAKPLTILSTSLALSHCQFKKGHII